MGTDMTAINCREKLCQRILSSGTLHFCWQHGWLILSDAGCGFREDDRRIRKVVKATDAKIANRIMISFRIVGFFGLTKVDSQMLHLG
jgi:hypothetical protein